MEGSWELAVKPTWGPKILVPIIMGLVEAFIEDGLTNAFNEFKLLAISKDLEVATAQNAVGPNTGNLKLKIDLF